ncbi:uncharacterized protein LOC127080662 [Lathyrus oleraceus]|uniref:uncharacterized protein LOC127080662 n=1 Tax=Pisum sativum TaxID=3888 RepID=UPI0021D1AA9D|nr:uncharacterized protein LOC127080662 [Pisum sativum]
MEFLDEDVLDVTPLCVIPGDTPGPSSKAGDEQGTQFHNRIISRSSTGTKDIVRNFSVSIENDNLNSVPIENDNLDSVPIVDEVNNDDDADDDDDDNVDYDIFDPRNWDRLQPKLIDLLVVKGPKRDNSIVKGPRDRFLNVNNTSGQELFDVLQNELKELGLDLFDVRGQGYDNGSNMKGKHQGVQKRFLDINPRVFYTPCGCHSLNLALCDMTNSCIKAMIFFGVVQHIYTIFANSTKRWQILKDNVKGLTPKSLSSTRWESRVESVKAIRTQMLEFTEALLEVSENNLDPKIQNEVKSLATNELGDFEFLMAIIIWFEILSAINSVSKLLQEKDMLIDFAMQKIKGLISYFEGYRETGFYKVLINAKEIAVELNIAPIFPQRRIIKRKRQFDENLNIPSVELSEEESFMVNYFFYFVDQAVVSLNKRFEQHQEYESIFGFLFTSHKLQSLDDATLKSCCTNFEQALNHNEQSDIDGNEFFAELKLLREMLPEETIRPTDILLFLKGLDCFPNTVIAYRILLTIPVTVASAERSFSKLKLLKTYLRSTMSQERLNGLALIAIENDILETLKYEDLVDDFASKNVRRKALFM